MISEKTLELLLWHAGLVELEASDGVSMANALWKLSDNPADLHAATLDLIETLSILNIELNGPVPSESFIGCEAIPRNLVYALTEILSELRAKREQAELTSEAVVLMLAQWKVETAWLAVLAGDIDDLDEHLAEEALTLGLQLSESDSGEQSST